MDETFEEVFFCTSDEDLNNVKRILKKENITHFVNLINDNSHKYSISVESNKVDEVLHLLSKEVKDTLEETIKNDKYEAETSDRRIIGIIAIVLLTIFFIAMYRVSGKIYSNIKNKKTYTHTIEKIKEKDISKKVITNTITEENQESSKKIEEPIEEELPQFTCWVTSKEGLRVRNKPELSGEKIGLLDYKSKVDVYRIGGKEYIDNRYGFWLKIQFNNTFGWIFSGYVSVIPEDIYNEPEILPLTAANLAGTWSTNTEALHITEFSRGIVFNENGSYYSGLLHGSLGTIGNFEIDSENSEITLNYKVIDDTYIDETFTTYKIKIKTLSDSELIYDYINDDGTISDSETRINKRIPSRFIELKDSSTIDWLKYINKYGNEELFTGSTVFMYSVLCKKNDVSLFLLNSNIDINHKNCNGEKAFDFFGNNDDKYLFEILKPEKKEINNLEKKESDSIEIDSFPYEAIPYNNFDLI